MDTTSLQQTLDNLTAQETQQQQALTATQEQITAVQSQLKTANLVNQLEGLSAAEVESLNAALKSDSQNTSAISLTLPAAPAQEGAQA